MRLPKFWIAVRGVHATDIVEYPCKKPDASEGESVHLYAPVTRPSVCVWAFQGRGWGDGTTCGYYVNPSRPHYKFCPHCGNKIKRVKQ